MQSKFLSTIQIIKNTLSEILTKDKNAFIIGEGVKDPKGIFGTTKDLHLNFPNQVIESPVSENAMTGICIGAAKMGSRPIIVHQRVDFVFYALEQIINNMAKSHYISNGKYSIPLVMRLIIGRGWGQGPMHSQVLDTLFAQIPGLKVLIPVFPNEFREMLMASYLDKNPVIFLEHRWLHNLKGRYNKKIKYKNVFRPKKILSGKDVTIIASSYNVIEVMRINKILKLLKIKIDLINIRCLQPLKIDIIMQSLKKTGRLLIIENNYKKFGFGSEILSQIIEKDSSLFKKPPIRLGLPFYPTPMSANYSKDYYVNRLKIYKNILKIMSKNRIVKKKQFTNLYNSIFSNITTDIPDINFQGPF
jgi:pyruvate dehydrogenase E1 component beta subunit